MNTEVRLYTLDVYHWTEDRTLGTSQLFGLILLANQRAWHGEIVYHFDETTLQHGSTSHTTF